MIRNPSCLLGYGPFVKCGLHPYCLYLRRPQTRASPSPSHPRAAGPHHQRETLLAIYTELFMFRLRKTQIRFPSTPSIWNVNWELSGYQKILVSVTDVSNPSANSRVCPSPKGSLLSALAVFNVLWQHSLLSFYARNVFIQLYGECMWAERFPVPLTKPMLIPHLYCFIPANIFIFSSFKDSRANNLKESHAYQALLLCVLEQRTYKFDTRWVFKENKGLKKRDTRWSASWATTQCGLEDKWWRSSVAGGGEIHTSCSTSEASVFHPAPVTPTAPSEKAGAQQRRGQRLSFQAFCLRYGGRNCQRGTWLPSRLLEEHKQWCSFHKVWAIFCNCSI